jgi:uncharacterized protein (TIGR03435 family)
MTKLCFALLAALAANAAPAAFEVASVRPNQAGSAGGEGHTREKIEHSPIGLTMTNVTLSSCIKWAYGVRDFQISGAPGWFGTERYDINAKAPGPVSEDELKAMLQALLAERFRLAVRFEKKELPVYALAVARNGPKLHRAAGDTPATMLLTGGGLVFQSVSMADFADRLANRPLRVDRPVVDKTGLNGSWDFTLKFADNAAELKSSLEGMEKGDPGGPSLFTVIQEQLGLRLEPAKSSIDALMVEHADRIPGDN